MTLHDVIERCRQNGVRLTPAVSVFIAAQCCEAVRTPNPMRTLTPRTFAITADGHIRLRGHESERVGFGYLSPEAASGLSIDRRADVFTIGAILWELLAGRALFKGDTDYQTIELVRAAIIPASDVDRDIDAILRRALAKECAARYDSVDELARALLDYLTVRGIVITSNDLRALLVAA